MRTICKANTGNDIPSHSRNLGETDEARFSPLAIGNEYNVYGLMFMGNRVDYLVCPDGNGPCWMPSNLFDILDSMLPAWEICLVERDPGYSALFTEFGVTALVGYEMLVKNYQHYEGMLERDPIHLQKFFIHKQVIDQMSS